MDVCELPTTLVEFTVMMYGPTSGDTATLLPTYPSWTISMKDGAPQTARTGRFALGNAESWILLRMPGTSAAIIP